ncbi:MULTISPECIES: hypothetical protein [unclassified Kribbella]|uniref:hypothetical protein n=1 Tax=unclassified Kribbella TaxID=2644121 RepID=UPI0030176430
MELLIPLHGIGGRGDLPVPLWLAIYSAGAAVAVSFFALAAFWSRPRFEATAGKSLELLTRIVDNRLTRAVLKLAGLAALGLMLGAAWFGSTSPALNPAPTWLYVWIWVGIIPLSLLCGPIWRLANPFRTIAGLLRRTPYRKPPKDRELPRGRVLRGQVNLSSGRELTTGRALPGDAELRGDAELPVEAELPGEVELPRGRELTTGRALPGDAGSRGEAELLGDAELTEGRELSAYRKLPEGIAYWPAVAGLAGFLWLELAYPDGSAPIVVATFVTGYAVVNVVAGIVYGPAWFRIGDSFEVYAEVLARLSPLGRGPDGRLVLRNPLAGLATMPQEPGIVGLLCLLLGSTAFDGISRWSAWMQLTGELSRTQHIVVHTLGLAAAVAIVSVLFVLAAQTTGAAQVRPGAVGRGGLPGAFVHSLVPIAIGYAVAHYFSFAMFQGQEGVLLATDPFGRGWDLLGTNGMRIDYAFLSTAVIAGVQIGAIVLGHVLGVVSAHDRAAELFRRRQLRRAQYPMLAAMVAFTAGGIALVTAS